MTDAEVLPEEAPLPKPPKKKINVPTTIQMEAVECGAACLRSVLAYFKRWVPLEELRYECGVSRDGSKASNVLKAARKYGLESKGFKYDSLEALFDLPLPCILFWNFNHFVVLTGFDGEKALLMNPSTGPAAVSMQLLDDSYSGIVLTFEPGPEFERAGQKPSIIPGLKRRLMPYKQALLYVVLCGLLLVLPGLAIPSFTRVFIDEYLIGKQTWIVQGLMLWMGITLVIHSVIQYLQEYYLLRLETTLSLTSSAAFFNHVLRLPAVYFGQRFSGEIGSRVSINDKVAKVLGGQFATTVIDGMMTLFYAALMFLYDVTMTVTVIGLALFNVFVIRAAGRWRADANRRLMQDKGKLMGTAMGGLQMIETLKATGSESEFFGRWAGYHAKTVNADQSLGVISTFVSAVPALINMLTTAAVLTLGAYQVMNQPDFTVGLLVAYQGLLRNFTRPLGNFVNFGGTLQELEADMTRLDDVIEYPQDTQYDPRDDIHDFGPTAVKLSGHVELRNVSFGYNPLEAPLIDDFNLVIQPGHRVAFVGGSGSGKSTVARLISGLFKIWGGQILFDGVERERVPRNLLTDSVAVVDQEIFLFGGTVRDNASMWDPSIAPDRVRKACIDAQISEVVEEREGTYNSWVEEGGGNYSGGQAQRLEIARAFVGDPTILILDEATSALDPTTESEIQNALRRRGCTCIIIAHRLSTIRDCDEIVVMHRGKIVQRGTHDGMKDIEGPYKTLISA